MVEQGDVYWYEFGTPVGSEPGYRRPVVVVQSDAFNTSILATTIVAAMTGNLNAASMPGNVFVPAGESGLPKDSVINVTQIQTIDKSELHGPVGTLSRHLLAEVTSGIRLVLAS